MHLVHHPHPPGFLKAVRAELEPREAEHNLLLGTALTDTTAQALCTVHDARGLALATLVIPGRGRVLASPRDDARTAVHHLVGQLARGGPGPLDVEARVDLTDAFSRGWAEATGGRARVLRHQKLYALTELVLPRAVPGRLRAARREDVELLGAWWLAFEQEALGAGDLRESLEAVHARIASGQLFLWEDTQGVPRCMALWGRRTWRVASVGHVYTPPEARGRGYAAACTAGLSAHLLADGVRACVLFTDAANPTSNALYVRLGYRHLCDFRVDRLA